MKDYFSRDLWLDEREARSREWLFTAHAGNFTDAWSVMSHAYKGENRSKQWGDFSLDEEFNKQFVGVYFNDTM